MKEKMLNEVIAIAKTNKTDLDRAFDMFRSNSECGKENYRGSGTFDYTAEITDRGFGELHRAVLAYDRRRAEGK